MKILFITLKTFSSAGAIEKVCRLAGKAIHEYAEESKEDFKMYSFCDEKETKTEPYLPSEVFKGFEKKRWLFIIKNLQRGIKSRIVVLSQIDLLLPGYLIKLFSPKTKIILVVHGAEISKPLSLQKKRMLKAIDLLIPVSDFTKAKMKALFDLPEEKFKVINNCLDPFLPELPDESRRHECRSSYGIAETDFVLMTLSRLSSKEKSKGSEKVLIAVKKLQATFPGIKYLFVGKYDAEEKARLGNVIHDLGIEDNVIFTGFVPDAVMADFYNMADVFIMPGEKEGFGFPFINALYYNKPVIAGRNDSLTGTRDGNCLGTLIDLSNQEEITTTIQKVMTDIKAFMPDRKLVIEKFSFAAFKNNWKLVLEEVEGSKLKVES